MSDPNLTNLKQRIEKAKKKPTPKEQPIAKMGKFFNAGVELVAGVFVGVGLGLLFDWLFNTSPWGLISLFILGSIAGMLNVYRTLTNDKK